MNWRYFLLGAAVVAGLASGPSSLESAAASQPAITWGALAFAFVGSLLAIPLVLGFQVAMGKGKALRIGWCFFLVGAAYCTAAGLAALVVAATGPGFAPHTFLFFVLGLAMLAGLGIVKVVFARKFPSSGQRA
jgi:hypothetical protein